MLNRFNKVWLLGLFAVVAIAGNAMAEQTEYINLGERPRSLFFPVAMQNVIELENPTSEDLTFEVSEWGLQAQVPAGKHRTIYLNRQDNPSRRVMYKVYNASGGCCSGCCAEQQIAVEIPQNRATSLLSQSYQREQVEYYQKPEPVYNPPKKVIRGYW